MRVNLQTGLKEAKLLDENEAEQTTNAADDGVHGAGNLKVSALTEVKDQSVRPEEYERVKEHFKSYKEIKEELGDLMPKTDAEVLNGLLEDFKNLSDKGCATNYKYLTISFWTANDYKLL